MPTGVHWNILLAESLFVLNFKRKDLKENKKEALINTTLLCEDETMNGIGLKSIISTLPLKQMLPKTLFFLLRSLRIANKRIPQIKP